MRLLAVVVPVFVLAACHPARFVRTELDFSPNHRDLPTDVFALRPPMLPYRAVGYIKVELSPGSAEDDFIAAAITEARDVGCDVLVDKRLPAAVAWQLVFPARARLLLAQHDHSSHSGGSEPRSSATPSTGSSGGGSSNDARGSGPSSSGGRGEQAGMELREYECGLYLPAPTKAAPET